MTTSNTCDQYEKQNDAKKGQIEVNIEQYHHQAGDSSKKGIIDIYAKNNAEQENKVKRTRSGHFVKSWTGSHTCNHSKSPAGMSASTEKSYG